ncbi:MAG: hydroxyacid dehydrogenase [Clostridia bacterium]|nr:hydroxyacid dehydrogenase [Clostridia bacterium]
MHIVILESLGVSGEKLEEAMAPYISAGHTFAQYERTLDVEKLRGELMDADAAILANMPLPADALKGADKLRFIDVAFTGCDHIPLDKCRERGITVSNASGYATHAVAELAVSLALGLKRELLRGKEGTSKLGAASFMGTELYGKQVGIVGLGKIGLHAARLFSAFGCKVVGTAGTQTDGEREGVPCLPLNILLDESDIVVLACPLNQNTRGLIGREALSRMRRTALLVNVARGPVVDSEALATALKEEKIAGAGLDVFDTEPPLPGSSPLLDAPHVLFTPHIGYRTQEAMESRLEIVFGNLGAYLAGKPVNLV